MKFVLVGQSNSGKTYLAEYFKSKGLKECKFTTTRPKRGIDDEYIFTTRLKFEKEINEYIIYNEYNNWYYGFKESDVNESDFIILAPAMVGKFKKLFPDAFIILLEPTEEIIRKRVSEKNNHDEFETYRRYFTDKFDFWEFERKMLYDLKITINNKNGIDNLIKIINI